MRECLGTGIRVSEAEQRALGWGSQQAPRRSGDQGRDLQTGLSADLQTSWTVQSVPNLRLNTASVLWLSMHRH